MTEMMTADDAPPLAFTPEDLSRAHAEWGCSCGPAAVAALLGLTPEAVRPHLGYFELKRHMTTADVLAALRSLGREATDRRAGHGPDVPRFGLCRVQWGGSWMRPGVHPGARAARTHWVATRAYRGMFWCFDANHAAWEPLGRWWDGTARRVASSVKGGDGTFAVAGCVDVEEAKGGRP